MADWLTGSVSGELADQQDNLGVVRGRIEFARDIRENYVLRQRTYCRYSELIWDIPENQVRNGGATWRSGSRRSL